MKIIFLALVLSLAGTALLHGQTISTTAGNGTQGSSGDNGSPTSANLNLPTGVTGDTSGTIYIADTGNNRIRRINSSRDSITTYAGTGTAGFSGDGTAATTAKLDAPAGVFVDSVGTVYIADTGNQRIRQISTAGVITTIAGTGTAGFSGDGAAATTAKLNGPTAVYARGGNIYIADTGNNRIRRINSSGNIATIAGKDTTSGLFIDDTTAVAATLNAPSGVFVDTAGNVYIADTNHHRIRKIAASDSTISTIAGTGSPGFTGDGDLPTNARLSFPSAVAVDSLGTLYIADRFNHRIRRINPAGNITTIAGIDSFGFGGDGAAGNIAKLASPGGLFLARADTLYIADASNHRIRRLAPDDTRGLTLIDSVGPGHEARLLSVSLTGDAKTTVNSLSFTLSDLSSTSGLSISDLVEFRLWESSDDSLSSNDTQIGSLDASLVSLGSQATILASSYPKPSYGSKRYYILSVRIALSAPQGHVLRVGVATGALSTTSGNRGNRIIASDSSALRIDALATKLVFTRHPSGTFSGTALKVQPIVSAINDSGLVDFDFVDTVTVSTSGSGTLLHNRAVAVNGIATFTNLTYSTSIDDEKILLFANDEISGIGGNLDSLISDTLTINVVNDRPVVDFPALVLKEDDLIGFRTPFASIVTDPDDTTFTFSFSSSHINASVSTTNDSIIVVPEADWFGIDTLTVTASDPFGLTHSDQGIIEIQAVNDPPELLLADSLVFAEGDTLTLNLQEQVNDVDNAFADLTWVITPSDDLSTALNGNTSQLQLWAAPDTSGSFTIQFQVQDPDALFARDTLQVTINPVNDPPVLSLLDAIILQGETLSVDLSAATSDTDHSSTELSWTAQADSFVTIQITGGTALLTPRAAFSGARNLTFTATDPIGGQSTDSFRLTVLRINQSPVLSALPDTTLAPGDTLAIDLDLFVTDPDDSTSTLIWNTTGGSRISPSLLGSVLTLAVPLGSDSYSEKIAIHVFDLFGAAAHDTFAVAVAALLPPIAGVPDIEFEAGKIFEFTLAPYLNGETTALSAIADSTLQVVIHPAEQRVTVSTIDNWKGTTTIVFSAESNRGFTAFDTVAVIVNNTPPVVEGLPELFLDAGLSAQLALDTYARDDEDTALLNWLALPGLGLQVSIHSVLHIATISASDQFSGLTRVVFQATDVQGATAGDTLLINVRGTAPDTTTSPADSTTVAALLPPIAGVPDIEFEAGKIFEFTLAPYLNGETTALSAIADSTLQVVIHPAEQRVTVSTIDNWKGTTTIVFSAESNRGFTAFDTVAVIVNNTPPVVEGLPELFLDAGLSAQLALDTYARDDEDTALLNWLALPGLGLQVSIHSVLHIATISASDQFSGLTRVVFQATDVQGATAGDTLLINVRGTAPDTTTSPADSTTTSPTDSTATSPTDSTATSPTDSTATDTTDGKLQPTISGIPALSFHRDQTQVLTLDRYVEDDGPLSALLWSATPTPTELLAVAIDSTRKATVSALQDSGHGTIIFRVEDLEGFSALAEIQVEILPSLTDSEPEASDFDRDGRIGFSDFFRFVDALGLTIFHPDWDPAFDLNDDGQITLDDFFLFVDAFEASNTGQ